MMMSLKVNKVYDIEGTPMKYLYDDGFWKVFEETYTSMQRRYVSEEIERKNLSLYDFRKDV